jgi:hypothetical protein
MKIIFIYINAEKVGNVDHFKVFGTRQRTLIFSILTAGLPTIVSISAFTRGGMGIASHLRDCQVFVRDPGVLIRCWPWPD